ncbi:hypothetical protein VSK91_09160 [Bacillus swezeyi]|uniref:hypothetical protein n=1 Tax=Bacillus swezeyi TaxID=1925020 RepID=UPI0039C6D115
MDKGLKFIWSNKILFTISLLVQISAMCFAIFIGIGKQEFASLIELSKESAAGFSVFLIIFLFVVLFILVQLYFGSILAFLIAKYIFKINIEFENLFKSVLILTIFLSISVYWNLALFYNSTNLFTHLINPFILIGFISFAFLIKRMSLNNSWFKPLIFTVSTAVFYFWFLTYI